MTKEEIKALVVAKIAGQGSAIDAASVLPTILNAIIDADKPIIIPESIQIGYSYTKADMLAAGLTETDLEDLMSGVRPILVETSDVKILASPSYALKPHLGDSIAIYGGIFPNEDAEVIRVRYDGADYELMEYTI